MVAPLKIHFSVASSSHGGQAQRQPNSKQCKGKSMALKNHLDAEVGVQVKGTTKRDSRWPFRKRVLLIIRTGQLGLHCNKNDSEHLMRFTKRCVPVCDCRLHPLWGDSESQRHAVTETETEQARNTRAQSGMG